MKNTTWKPQTYDMSFIQRLLQLPDLGGRHRDTKPKITRAQRKSRRKRQRSGRQRARRHP